jgi:hypothetical protein
MLVTLLGIVTLVAEEPPNAESPMLVTGSPVMMAGIVTAPLGPGYPVMVIAPLLVV